MQTGMVLETTGLFCPDTFGSFQSNLIAESAKQPERMGLFPFVIEWIAAQVGKVPFVLGLLFSACIVDDFVLLYLPLVFLGSLFP